MQTGSPPQQDQQDQQASAVDAAPAGHDQAEWEAMREALAASSAQYENALIAKRADGHRLTFMRMKYARQCAERFGAFLRAGAHARESHAGRPGHQRRSSSGSRSSSDPPDDPPAWWADQDAFPDPPKELVDVDGVERRWAA